MNINLKKKIFLKINFNKINILNKKKIFFFKINIKCLKMKNFNFYKKNKYKNNLLYLKNKVYFFFIKKKIIIFLNNLNKSKKKFYNFFFLLIKKFFMFNKLYILKIKKKFLSRFNFYIKSNIINIQKKFFIEKYEYLNLYLKKKLIKKILLIKIKTYNKIINFNRKNNDFKYL